LARTLVYFQNNEGASMADSSVDAAAVVAEDLRKSAKRGSFA
jgi:hypothetical protein